MLTQCILNEMLSYNLFYFIFKSQDKVVQLVIRVLTAFKASDIEKGVNALDSQTLDILMKYIYRGFEFPSEGSSAALLSWHEKVIHAQNNVNLNGKTYIECRI